MNDSFLEDLDLLPSNENQTVSSQQINRHVTMRNPMISKNTDSQGVTRKSKSPLSMTKKATSKDSKKLVEHNTKKYDAKTKGFTKRDKVLDERPDLVVEKGKNDNKENKEEIKPQESRTKIPEHKRTPSDRNRRIGNRTENSSDISSKENSCPSESSVESCSQGNVKEKSQTSNSSRKHDTKETDPVALLNAIKDLVSSYTKQESTKILLTMQELHVNTQANLLKNFLHQADMLNDMLPGRRSSRMSELIEENEMLREDLMVLQIRNDICKRNLQQKCEEFEIIKQENIELKLKCKELSK